MSEAQIRAFRIMAVGYAVLRELSEDIGPPVLTGINEGDLAKSLGRAAIAAVDATAEVQRNG